MNSNEEILRHISVLDSEIETCRVPSDKVELLKAKSLALIALKIQNK